MEKQRFLQDLGVIKATRVTEDYRVTMGYRVTEETKDSKVHRVHRVHRVIREREVSRVIKELLAQKDIHRLRV
jgi:hypothetical protein